MGSSTLVGPEPSFLRRFKKAFMKKPANQTPIQTRALLKKMNTLKKKKLKIKRFQNGFEWPRTLNLGSLNNSKEPTLRLFRVSLRNLWLVRTLNLEGTIKAREPKFRSLAPLLRAFVIKEYRLEEPMNESGWSSYPCEMSQAHREPGRERRRTRHVKTPFVCSC